nr:hypothetical protein [Halovivax sp. KZCA124]
MHCTNSPDKGLSETRADRLEEQLADVSIPQGFVCNALRVGLVRIVPGASTPQGFVWNSEADGTDGVQDPASTPSGFV